MPCSRKIGVDAYRLVGDPVDVVTGANIDEALDFRLVGPINLEWWRHYSSAQSDQLGPLGWGHTHEYQRWLEYDIDGLSYIDPTGSVANFERLEEDGASSHAGGLRLVRLDANTYHLHEDRQPTLEFAFSSDSEPARLVRLFQNEHQIRFFYHPDGRLKGLVDALERRIRVDATSQGLITGLYVLEEEHPKGRVLLLYRYDEQGCLLEGTDPYGHSFSFAYDAARRISLKTDRRGYSFQFEYDQEGRCVRSVGEDGLLDTRLDYRLLEKRTLVTRADGGEWIYNYDDYGLISSIIDPYGGIQQFRYDDQGRLGEEIDPNGNTTRILSDERGRPIGKISLLGDFSTDISSPLQRPSHRMATSALEWDYGALLVSQTIRLPAQDAQVLSKLPYSAVKFIQTHLEDSASNPVHDEFGLLIKQEFADRTSHRWTYDANGNNQRFTDREGSNYLNQYGSWNLIKQEIDPLDRTTSYQYSTTEQLVGVTDAGGTKTQFRYDLKDRVTQIRRHSELKEEYRYDAADNLVQKLDSGGKVLLDISYNAANLAQERRLASGERYSYEYDEVGRIVQASSDDTTTLFAYDPFANKTLDQRDGKGVEHRFRGPDLLETTVLKRFCIRYDYQDDGTIKVQDPGGKYHQINRFDNGILLRHLSNGSAEVSQYDDDGRCLTKVILRGKTDTYPWSRQYIYSPEGDLTTVKDSNAGLHTYEYDAAHRLISARLPDRQRQTFGYDAADNLLEQPGLSGVQLLNGNRLASANNAQFSYNTRNHIDSRSGASSLLKYRYDSLDMLVRVEGSKHTWQAEYDPLGRRIRKQYGENSTEYYWDTDRLAAEINGDGTLRIYIYADAYALTPFMCMDYDSIDADPQSGKRYFIFSNQISAPTLVEDESGDIVWRARLAPYGVAEIDPGSSIAMPLRFPGHYYDAELGLHYNRFRYYSPELGRYLQSDPAGLAYNLNVYAYTTNPLTRVDLQGLGCVHPPGTRRTWTPEEMQRAKELIDNELQSTNFSDMQARALREARESGRQRPLTPKQQRLMDQMGTPVERIGDKPDGTFGRYYQSERVPLDTVGGRVSSEDLRNLTAHTGLEHGVVRGQDGNLYVTRGSPNNPGELPNDHMLAHSHPFKTPPSPGDLKAAGDPNRRAVGTGYGAIDPDGRTTDYGARGQDPNTKVSYVGPDGTIDGRPRRIQ